MGVITMKALFNVPRFMVFSYLSSSLSDPVFHLKFSISLVFKFTVPKRHLIARSTVKGRFTGSQLPC
jgi:hypothetical protein